MEFLWKVFGSNTHLHLHNDLGGSCLRLFQLSVELHDLGRSKGGIFHAGVFVEVMFHHPDGVFHHHIQLRVRLWEGHPSAKVMPWVVRVRVGMVLQRVQGMKVRRLVGCRFCVGFRRVAGGPARLQKPVEPCA